MVAEVLKIDSNVSGLRMAKEASLGVLPGSPTWIEMQPNGYNDFGGQLGLVARNPINLRRQRLKGTVTDLDAGGGVNMDLTQSLFSEFWPGLFLSVKRAKPHHGGRYVTPNPVTVDGTGYDIGSDAATAGYLVDHLVFAEGFTNAANNGLKVVTAVTGDVVLFASSVVEASPPANAEIRVVGYEFASADLDVTNPSGFPTLTSGADDWTQFGFIPGEWIHIGGAVALNKFVNAENNGLARIRSITTAVLTLDKGPGGADGTTDMAAETGTALEIRVFFGDLTRNESADSANFDDATYTIERTLGVPNPVGSPGVTQAETLTGSQIVNFNLAVPLPAPDSKITMDVGFLATDNVQYTGEAGDLIPSDGETILTVPAADVFNPTNDIERFKLAIQPAASAGDAAPDPLFAFITEMQLSLSNNSVANKAVGTLGAFAVTAGTFTVDAQITAYFSEVAGQQAVRNNSDVTLEIAFAKTFQGRKAGILFDIPLGALGDARLNVEQDAPITLPLQLAGAEFEDFGHSLVVMEFWYLPA